MNQPMLEIPPCVRGRGIADQQIAGVQGNTPVRTGKRGSTRTQHGCTWKYPRAYGEEL